MTNDFDNDYRGIPVVSMSEEARLETVRILWYSLGSDDVLFKKPLGLQIEVASIIIDACKVLLEGIDSNEDK